MKHVWATLDGFGRYRWAHPAEVAREKKGMINVEKALINLSAYPQFADGLPGMAVFIQRLLDGGLSPTLSIQPGGRYWSVRGVDSWPKDQLSTALAAVHGWRSIAGSSESTYFVVGHIH